MNTVTCRCGRAGIGASLLLFVAVGAAFGQSASLVLASASVPPGGSVVLGLSLTSAATAPAGLQWTLNYSPNDISAISVAAGSVSEAAGKSTSCVGSSGSYTCLAVGLNSNTIGNGVVAAVTVTTSLTAASSTSITLTGTLGVAPNGDAVAVTGTGGTITVTGSVDTTAPSVPTGLTATVASSSQINLAWTASTDNVAVAGYLVYRNGAQAGTATTTSYSNSGLTAATSYTYTVAAYDAAGNLSAQSTAATATTNAPAPVVSSLFCSPSSLLPNTTTTFAVTLSGIAPAGGSTVTLFGDNPALTVPDSVTVAAGATSATFYATAGTLSADQAATVTASSGGASRTVSIFLIATQAYPANGATHVPVSATLSWDAVAGAVSTDVYFGTKNTPPKIGTTTTDYYSAIGVLGPATQYFWQLRITLPSGTIVSPVWQFTTEAAPPAAARQMLAWRNDTTGGAVIQYMKGAKGDVFDSLVWLADQVPGWRLVTLADVNRDGTPDAIWQSVSTGGVFVWYLGGPQGVTFLGGEWITTALPGWNVVCMADLNHDGTPDLVLQNTSLGTMEVWHMGGATGTTPPTQARLLPIVTPGYTAVGMADFNGDGNLDLVLQNDSSGEISVWYLGPLSTTYLGTYTVLSPGAPGWRAAALADLDKNGKPDLIWQNDSLGVVVCHLDGPEGSTFLDQSWLAGPTPGWTVTNLP